MVNFPTRIPNCDSCNPILLDIFFLPTLVRVLQWLSLQLEILIMLLSQFPLTFCQTQDHSQADWDGLQDHLRDVPWEDTFKFSAFAPASEFYELVLVGIDLYNPHRKYQVKPHKSPWFSAAYAAAIVHRNHFFRL